MRSADTRTDDASSEILNGQVFDIVFSEKVEYFGNGAQTIAFLKREDYSVLDLKAEPDLEKLLD